jgi:uncharacterized damage-inducible protein DinB
MEKLLPDLLHEFRRHRALAERAMHDLDKDAFSARPAPHVNPVATIVKHLAGNLLSRWTDFLATDGEKPTRDRDAEFILTPLDTSERLMRDWNRGWDVLLEAVSNLTDADLAKTITIRGEPHTIYQALIRALTHIAYHTGQILYLVRLLNPTSQWQTIPPGQSAAHRPSYRQPPSP